MKTLLLTGLLLFFSQVSAFSQRFYVRAGGGYTWPAGAQHMTSDYKVHYVVATNTYMESFADKRGSYGQGFTGSLALGYRFTDQLWVEAGPAYLAGKTYHGKEQYTGAFTGDVARETYARMPALAAALVISSSGRKWRPYAKAGIIVGKPRIYNEDREAFNTDHVRRQWEIKGKTALGFQGGLGFNYVFNARLSLFVEGIFRTLSFVPEKGTVTSYEKNGQDEFNTLTVRQRELTYRSSYTQDSGSQAPADQPTPTNNDPFPFGSAGLQLGLQLHLR